MSSSSVIESFFQRAENKNIYRGKTLIVAREDGILLYSNGDKGSYHELSALIGGMWQAAEALQRRMNWDPEEVYRLSFDTSSQGIYVVKIQGNSQDFYMALLYDEELAPGKIKNQLRFLAQDLSVALKESRPEKVTGTFDNITDAEMDELFHFVD